MDHLKDISTQQEKTLKKILSWAKKEGATQAETTITAEDGFGVTVRNGELETVEYHKDKAVGISVYFDYRIGNVVATDMSEKSIKEALKKACQIAKKTQPDPCFGLADKELMAKNDPDLTQYYPWNITPKKAIQKAMEGEKIALSLDKRIVNSEGFSIVTVNRFAAYGNSHGFIASAPSTVHSMNCGMIAEMNGKMERDSDYTVARDANDLADIHLLAKSTVNLTVRRLNAKKIKTRTAPLIFDAGLATGFIGHFISAISGSNIYRKSSFLVDHLGRPIFPDFINIEERPYIPKGIGSATFDAEGVATRNQHFIKNGVLQSYVLNSYSARKLGLQTTANAGGVHNLMVNTGNLSTKELLKKMGTGLYITELIGSGVNLVTGDYSRGAVGLWIKNGEIQYPVSEITIAGNLKDMFKNIIAVGCDIDNRNNIQTGSILMDEMMIAGN